MSALILALDIPPRGDFRLRKSGTPAPSGFFAIGRDWLVRSQVMAIHQLEIRHGDDNDALRLAHSGGKPAAPEAERLAMRWRTAMAGIVPNPRPAAPQLVSGLVPGGLLAALEDEQTRARQLVRYQDAWIKATGSGPDPARPFEHRLLQHLATLKFPSATTLRLRRDENGVTVYVQETGPLERLHDRIRIKTFWRDPKSCELYLDRTAA